MDRVTKLESLVAASPRSHFLDSGSFSLWTRALEWSQETGEKETDFYNTEEFWNYIDGYAEFIKRNKAGIDVFANVDVIPSKTSRGEDHHTELAAELTYRNQLYLEDKHGLQPIPIVHYKTSLRWLDKYLRRGYQTIGLGGLVGSSTLPLCLFWLDRCFDIICDTKGRLPSCRVHGFGVTSLKMLTRYPWYSVDSTTWTKLGAYGDVLFPRKRAGAFRFDIEPYHVTVSDDMEEQEEEWDSSHGFHRVARTPKNAQRTKGNRHVLTLPKAEKDKLQEWLDFIGIPMGRYSPTGDIEEIGVTTRHVERRAANLLYFFHLCRSLPPYPQPWRKNGQTNFGLVY